jgi:hypothetical protein
MLEPLRWITRIPRLVLYSLIMYAIDVVTVAAVLIIFVIDPVSDTLRLRFGLGWYGVLVGWAILRAGRAFVGFMRTWEIDIQLRIIPAWLAVRDQSLEATSHNEH